MMNLVECDLVIWRSLWRVMWRDVILFYLLWYFDLDFFVFERIIQLCGVNCWCVGFFVLGIDLR